MDQSESDQLVTQQGLIDDSESDVAHPSESEDTYESTRFSGLFRVVTASMGAAAMLLFMAAMWHINAPATLTTPDLDHNKQEKVHMVPSTDDTIWVAGVPIYNYHLAYTISASEAAERRGEWIAILPQGLDNSQVEEYCENLPGRAECLNYGHPDSGGMAYVQLRATEEELTEIFEQHPGAEFVEPDWNIELVPEIPDPEVPDDNLPSHFGVAGLTAAPSWGLDRIDDRGELDGTFDAPPEGGQGVHVYVIDTGVRATHNDFEGRAIPTLEVLGHGTIECDAHNNDCAADGNGHGTHVAAIVAGKQFGVAKGASVHAVKILDDRGFGRHSWLIQAIDWVVTNGFRPAVILINIGQPGNSKSMQRAIDIAVDHGVTIVAAAGNNYDDACEYSPSYVHSAIVVGATNSQWDRKASYSNWGPCVDIFAPGSHIESATCTSDGATAKLSGTSMASPHVAGAAALLLGVDGSLSPADIKNKIISQGTVGRISGLPTANTPNVFLYTNFAEITDPSLQCFKKHVKYFPSNMPGQSRTRESSAAMCQWRCVKTPGCKFFSYWMDGGCHLQSQCSVLEGDITAVSGPAECLTPVSATTTEAPAQDCYLRNTKYEPVDMVGTERTEEPNEEMCQCRCAHTPGCAHFSFWSDGGCHLQSAQAVAVDADSITAGPASCYNPSGNLKVSASPLAGNQKCFLQNTKYEKLSMEGVEPTNEDSAEMCQCRCSQTKGCAYFTYMGTHGQCYLAGIEAQPLVANGKTAGAWKCDVQKNYLVTEVSPGQSTSCIVPNNKYEPSLPGSQETTEPSAEVCQCRCAVTVGCAFFTYDDAGTCTLHPAHSTPVFKPEVVGGPATCPPE